MTHEDRDLLEILARPEMDPGARREASQVLARRLESADIERRNLMGALERAAVELESRVQELSLLRRLSEVLRQVVDDGALAQHVLLALATEQDLEDVSLWMAEGEELSWRCGVGHGERHADDPDGPPERLSLGEGLLGQVACRHDPLVVHDAEVEARCRTAERFLRRGSFCLFTLVSFGRRVGSRERYAFPTERVRILTMAADEIAQGLAASELFEKLSRYSENLSEVVADRSRALEEISRELAQYKAAMSDFWRRLQVGGLPPELLPMPGSERLLEAARHLAALIAATGTSSGTLSTAATLLDDFMRDYQAYVRVLENVSCPVLLDRVEREHDPERLRRAA